MVLKEQSLARVRDAYTTWSETYADMFADNAATDPLDLGLLDRWLVGLTGPVLDLGCGPGHLTAYLAAAGTDALGVDPVAAFIDIARTRFPGVAFTTGSFATVDVEPGSLAGLLSWYSTIHLEPAELDAALVRFRELLMPGGTLVLGFFDHVGGESETFEHRVTTARRWPLAVLGHKLEAAGFDIRETNQREIRVDRLHGAIVAVAI